MATLTLASNKAERDSGGQTIGIHYDGGRTSPLPPERQEIRTAADAQAAFSAYAEKVRATGKPACVSATLARGHRAPSGFRKLKLTQFVNV
jgi:hypothetical protein